MHRRVAPERFKAPDLSAIERYFVDLLDTPGVSISVADLDGVVQGYAMARVHDIPETTLTTGGLIVELDQISVDPDMRGRGIGESQSAKWRP